MFVRLVSEFFQCCEQQRGLARHNDECGGVQTSLGVAEVDKDDLKDPRGAIIAES